MQWCLFLIIWWSSITTVWANEVTKPEKHQFSSQKMGTTFRLVFYHQSASEARAIADLAFQQIDSLNLIFSDYHPDSEVSRLSATAGGERSIKVSTHLWNVLTTAQEISEKSQGAFDITIGPLTKLWRRAFRQDQFPDLKKLEQARSLVNYRWVKFNWEKREVTLVKPGMRLDLGGIAKGYTVDQVIKFLSDRGITAAVVDGGGDIRVMGQPPAGDRWNIQGFSGNNEVQNRAFASSGDMYKFLIWEGRKYSHIIDPRNGLGVTKNSQIVVMASSCTIADALASAISILGPEKSRELLKQFGASLLI